MIRLKIAVLIAAFLMVIGAGILSITRSDIEAEGVARTDTSTTSNQTPQKPTQSEPLSSRDQAAKVTPVNLAAPVPSDLTPDSLGLTASTTSLSLGDTVRVAVYINAVSAAVNTAQLQLQYDPAVLTYVSSGEPTDFAVAAASDNPTAGQLRIARASATPLEGIKRLTTLTFTVNSASTGTTELTIDQSASLLVGSTGSDNILRATTGLKLHVK